MLCLAVPPLVLMLVGSSLQAATAATAAETDVRSVKEAEKTGNFMEDEQWLSTISQYSRKIKHWNRFRDVPESSACEHFSRMMSSSDLLLLL
ncbi:testican-2-like [Vanacampus margaritifer]